jgi:hypothetical protein
VEVSPWERLHGFIAPGLVVHRTRQPDMTALIDDHACRRMLTCTLCGPASLDMELRCWQHDTLAVGVLVCAGCRRVDAPLLAEAVEVNLRARYDPQRFGPP